MYLYPPLYHQIDDPQEGQILVYDADTQLWVNSAAPEPGGGSGGRTLFLDTAGGAYTSTPITGALIEDPDTGAKTTITGSITNSTEHVASFTTPASYLTSTRINTGFWLLHLHGYGSTAASYRMDLSYVDADGTSNKTLIVSGVGGETFLPAAQEMTSFSLYVPETTLPDITKRLVIDLYVTATGGNRAFTFEFRDGTVSHVHTTLPVAGGGGGGSALASESQRYSSGTAETFDRLTGITTARTHSTGVTYLTALTPNADVTAGGIGVYSSAAGSGLTIVRLGLYTFDGTTYTLVARTADVKASFNANNAFITSPFDTAGGYPASYNLVAGTLYYVGILEVGTTPATINGPSTPSTVSGVTSFINSGTPKLSRSMGGQTDLAATYLESSVNNSVIMAYARLS